MSMATFLRSNSNSKKIINEIVFFIEVHVTSMDINVLVLLGHQWILTKISIHENKKSAKKMLI